MTLSDISIRGQVRLLEGEVIGFAVRAFTGTTRASYGGFLWEDRAGIGIGGSEGETLAESPVNLNVRNQDVLLQFDAIGDSLKLWVWPVSEDMPQDPVVSAVNDEVTNGGFFLWGANLEPAGIGQVQSSAFRFVHVANTHIPEPSTFALAALVFLAALCRVRRMRRV